MGRGRARLKRCFYCGGMYPIDKMCRIVKRSFSYFDQRMGLRHRGTAETAYCCPKCARRRSVQDRRPKKGRPKKRY